MDDRVVNRSTQATRINPARNVITFKRRDCLSAQGHLLCYGVQFQSGDPRGHSSLELLENLGNYNVRSSHDLDFSSRLERNHGTKPPRAVIIRLRISGMLPMPSISRKAPWRR